MRHSDGLVKVIAGPADVIGDWADVLMSAGIRYQLVGAGPTAGSVELWVHHADVEAAAADMATRFHNSLDDAPPS
jgi:hypothetical protein